MENVYQSLETLPCEEAEAEVNQFTYSVLEFYKFLVIQMGHIRILDIRLELACNGTYAGEYTKRLMSFAFETIFPHWPHLQAITAVPIPRIIQYKDGLLKQCTFLCSYIILINY